MRMREGLGLSAITEQVRRAYGVSVRILPMSEDPAPTFILLSGGRRVHFEEYLARDGAPDDVRDVDLSAAEAAKPAPGVLEALAEAEAVVLCPSNPVVSIGPILAVPGVRAALRAAAAPRVAISPLIGGAPVKGPADRLLRGIGVEVSAAGVAGHYQDLLDGFVIDRRDAGLRERIEAMGLACEVTETLMRTPEIAADLARRTLALAARVRPPR